MTFDVIVIGGGITGLVAAYRLTREGKRVLLIEKSPRLGGNISTLREAGYIFEEGPQTILANNPAVWELVEELKAPVEKASPSSQKRYIYKGGKLIPIPLKPQEFLTTPLVGIKSKLLLFGELFKKPLEVEDTSVANFVREHFGEEFLTYFVQPFVSGIYAGDAERLSLRYAFPKLWEIQRRYGSLLKAFIKEKRVAPKGELISFKGGLKTLIDLLAEKIPNKEPNTSAEVIEKEGDLYRVLTDRGTFLGKRVIITTPAGETAKLLRKVFPPAEAFKDIHYPPVAVVSLAFPKIGLDGFGFLVPKVEGLKILGAIYVSSLFPNRCPAGEDCLSVFLCGDTQKEVCHQSEEEILKTAVGEIRKVFPQIGEIKFQKLKLWKKSIPQYTVGYGRFYKLYEELKRREPNLEILSNFLGGSSLAKCIEKGMRLTVGV
ncbi:MAG TPA: protoporphyrinogen oxidase [Aquifex sp.]|nr:protoporphyrinogen oxidase [Aquifex sp.]